MWHKAQYISNTSLPFQIHRPRLKSNILFRNNKGIIMALPKDATLNMQPFEIAITDSQLNELHTLIKLSKLPPPTYEGTKEEYGVTSKWME